MDEMLRLIRTNKKALAGAVIVGFYVLLAIFGPWLVPDPTAFVAAPHQPPSAAHWFGTTGQGQDVLAQVVAGTRTTLSIGFAVGFSVTLIGALIGICAGYFRGRVDDALSLLINVFLVIPGLPLAIILATYLPPGAGSLALVLIVSGWAWNARVFRSQALTLGKKDFVAAAAVGGETASRIVAVEILPNMISLLVSAFIGATIYAIGAQVGLEFLGLGDVGAVTWGTNLYWAANDSALLTGSWWILLPTGLSVAFVGFGLTLINFAIDELNNPRLRAQPGDRQEDGPTKAPAADTANDSTEAPPVLRIEDLIIEFPQANGAVRAVDNVSLTLRRGQWYALAGESGSGKSTIGYAILKLLADNARIRGGTIDVLGHNIVHLQDEQLRSFRWRKASMVFQAAMNALNPVMTVGAQLRDTLLAHQPDHPDVDKRAKELVEMVGIDPVHLDSYPHQLSGGMRQRVVISVAMAHNPDLLIMDEPTTALDVVVQKEILQRISQLKEELGFSVLFISHDMPLLMDIATHIGVLKKGALIEEGTVEELRRGAQHPYTRTLLDPYPETEDDATAARDGARDVVLSVQNLDKSFWVGQGSKRRPKQVLHDINFDLHEGEVIALVGESGSGKSTIARIIARIETADNGKILLDDSDVLVDEPNGASLRYRGDVQMIFQDPFGSLNPVHSIAHHLTRPLLLHGKTTASDANARAAQLLDEVDLGPGADYAGRYPHALSGGQRQRVAIARALAVEPRVILADEPTSMLDVSTRLGILNQLRGLCDTRDIAMLFVTHDLPSARYVADRIIVLYAGHVVEQGPTNEVLDAPKHPYTQVLLAASPRGDGSLIDLDEEVGQAGAGNIPAPTGCPFRLRCPHATERCAAEAPVQHDTSPAHKVLCHLYDEASPMEKN